MRGSSRRGILLTLIYGAALGLVAYLAVVGSDYYLTPLIERPRHTDYWQLKPGGSRGLAYGIVGSLLMVLMLVYTMRKRIPLLRRLGSLSGWLDFHIFCGVIGPLLVVLHSSFKVGGLVALSFWSMVLVALSGFVGRYLYVQFPRRRSGDELDLAEAKALSGEIAERLQNEFRIPADSLADLDRLARSGAGRETGLLALLCLFYYWHVLHKPFAVIMYLFMIVHVAVALATGYGWAWG